MKTQAYNPFLPSFEYIPDAEPYVFGDRVYIYGSHDRFDGEDFCLNDYVCWSAPVEDLGAWRKEGTIYRAAQDPLNADGTQNLFAPDVQVGEDGRYYLYYCLSRSPMVSVAVCDTPAGQYQFYGHVRYEDGTLYGEREGDVFNFDPGVLRDDDGKIYLYTGFSFPQEAPMRRYLEGVRQIDGAYCVELASDMLTLKGEITMAVPGEGLAAGTDFEGHGFFEASSPRKIGGRYYLVYSSVKSHDLCYGVSDFPREGFRYGGVIVSNGDIGIVEEGKAVNYLGNTHGGLVEINGKWYIFYHRHTNRHRNSRQMCAEQVKIAEDGSIAQAELTSCGLNGGPLKGRGRYEARIACNLSSAQGTFIYPKEKAAPGIHPCFTQEGEDREDRPDQYIANLQDGAWAGFKYFDFQESGRITVSVRGSGAGKLLVATERDAAPAAEIPLRPSPEWHEETAQFHVPAGVHALYFTYRGTGAVDWQWFELASL